jgi:hypothetical protein
MMPFSRSKRRFRLKGLAFVAGSTHTYAKEKTISMTPTQKKNADDRWLRISVLAFLLLSGCNRTESDWKKAKDSNTAQAYTAFLARHPSGAHADEAKTAVDDLDWAAAKAAETIEACDEYLNAHPNGKHIPACGRLKEFLKDEPASAVNPKLGTLRLFRDSNGNLRQSGDVTLSIGGFSGLSGNAVEDYSNKHIINDTGEPIGLITMSRAGRVVATIFLSGKEAVFGPESRLVRGPGYIQASPGEHFHVTCGDQDGRVELDITKVAWDDNGNTTSVEGLLPTLPQSNGPDLRLKPGAGSPGVKNGILTVVLDSGAELQFKIRYGFGSKLLRVSP